MPATAGGLPARTMHTGRTPGEGAACGGAGGAQGEARRGRGRHTNWATGWCGSRGFKTQATSAGRGRSGTAPSPLLRLVAPVVGRPLHSIACQDPSRCAYTLTLPRAARACRVHDLGNHHCSLKNNQTMYGSLHKMELPAILIDTIQTTFKLDRGTFVLSASPILAVFRP